MATSNPIQHPLAFVSGSVHQHAARSPGLSCVAAPRSRRRRGAAVMQRQASSPAVEGGSGGQSASASASVTKRQQAKQLPRSVRWRLSLGLLSRPMGVVTAAGGCETPDKERMLKSVEDLNALRLRHQRSRYDELERRHYWRSTPLGIASDEAVGAACGAIDSSGRDGWGGVHLEGLHQVAPGDDPLTLPFPSQKNRSEERKQKSAFIGSGIFGGGKERRSRTGSLLTDSFTSLCSSSDGDGDEAACKGSRWADFYSTREVLDVIEKDLNRLPSDHYTVYHDWRIKKKGWEDHREREEKWRREQQKREEREERERDQQEERGEGCESDGDGDVSPTRDPLHCPSASMADEDARGSGMHHSMVSPPPSQKPTWSQSITMGLLKRRSNSADHLALFLDDIEEAKPGEVERRREEEAQAEIQTSIRERAGRISQILFVYAREHPGIGYRQGMHEVLSFLLLALETDLLERAIASERRRWRRNSMSLGLPAPGDDVDSDNEDRGTPAGVDSSGNVVRMKLLDPDYCLHDVFGLFEHVMTSLAPAYDAVPVGDETASALLEEARDERGESPMEAMTASVVSKIRYVARDEKLFGHILYMPVPPQLYFARWIRLMFGREVAGGTKSVMTLWGAFFDLASAKAASSNEVPITTALLDVLKTAAASMILLIRNQLLTPTLGPNGMMTGEPDPNVGIGYLMNYPPLKDIGTLVETISNLMSRERKLSNEYSPAKEHSKLSKKYVPSENYKIESIIEHPLQEAVNDDKRRGSGSALVAPSSTRSSSPNGDSVAYRNGQDQQRREELLWKVQDKLPQVTPPPRQQQHCDVTESVGIIAGGLIDLGSNTVNFGSKTASAAMASIEKKFEAHTHATQDHPLSRSDPLNDEDSGSANNINSEDHVINYRLYSSVQITQEVPHLNIGERLSQMPMDGNRPPDREDEEDPSSDNDEFASIEELEEHEISDNDDDGETGSAIMLDLSIASRLSASKSAGDAVQKSPTELASLLERSVGTLMTHFNEQLNRGTNAWRREGGGVSSTADTGDNSRHSCSTPILPEDIWNAMADVELVRKELLSQAAIAAIDHGRSTTSLRSSANLSTRRPRRTEDKRESWQL